MTMASNLQQLTWNQSAIDTSNYPDDLKFKLYTKEKKTSVLTCEAFYYRKHNGQDVQYEIEAMCLQVLITMWCIMLEGNGPVKGRDSPICGVSIEVSLCQQVSSSYALLGGWITHTVITERPPQLSIFVTEGCLTPGTTTLVLPLLMPFSALLCLTFS